jgi:hypothetical protein
LGLAAYAVAIKPNSTDHRAQLNPVGVLVTGE